MIELLLACLGIALAVLMRKPLRGTTLVAPWLWLLLSLVLLAVAELVAIGAGGSSVLVSPLRYAASCSTLCPLVALLGAKRPQDRGWHFVVATLWIVLAMPAFESLLLRPGQSLDVHGLRAWFLMLLILLGFINICPTRFWLAAVFLGAGQGILLAEFMPYGPALDRFVGPRATIYGVGLIVAAVAAANFLSAGPRKPPSLDRLWLDFRDWFGLFWGLRMIESVNAAAHLNGWPVRLGWRGFRTSNGSQLADLSPATAAALRQSLENVLRRFVSHTWIAHRLGEQVDWSRVTD